MNAEMMTLNHLLDGVVRGSIVVPEFQRGFVWQPEQVRSLLATVFNGWPAGSLLLMRGNPPAFRLRALLPDRPSIDPELVVLDGQQRLTALGRAIKGLGSEVYYIQIPDGDWKSGDEEYLIEDHIGWMPKDRWTDRHSAPPEQYAARMLPVQSLESPSDFFLWRDEATNRIAAEMQFQERRALTDFYKEHLATLHFYSIPALILEPGFDLIAIARIFERVNRTGTRLGAFDLMVARSFDPGWNLRDEWNSAKVQYWHVDRFLRDDGMPVLEAISLREQGNVRQSSVLELSPSVVRSHWAHAAAATEETLRFLARECGVQQREWLPYPAMLVGLTAVGLDGLLDGNERKLATWFWSRTFSQSFDVAANTRIVTEYAKAVRWLSGGATPDPASVSIASLINATRRSARAVWAGFHALLATRGDADLLGEGARLLSGEEESEPLLAAKAATRQSVSLFTPSSSKSESESDFHLRVLGMALVSRPTAQWLRRGGLLFAVQQALLERDRDLVDRCLQDQLLPPSAEILAGMSPSDILLYRLDRLRETLENFGLVVFEDTSA